MFKTDEDFTKLEIIKAENGYYCALTKMDTKPLQEPETESPTTSEDDLFKDLGQSISGLIESGQGKDSEKIAENIKKLYKVSQDFVKLRYSQARQDSSYIPFPRMEKKNYTFQTMDDLVQFVKTI